MKNQSITQIDIANFELKWGVALPEDYKRFLLNNSQDSLREKSFDIQAGESLDSSVIQDFFRLKAEPYRKLDFYLNSSTGRIPSGFVPVANDVFGNLILLSTGDERIYFWDHEQEDLDPSQAMTLLSFNFSEFLQSLRDIKPDE